MKAEEALGEAAEGESESEHILHDGLDFIASAAPSLSCRRMDWPILLSGCTSDTHRSILRSGACMCVASEHKQGTLHTLLPPGAHHSSKGGCEMSGGGGRMKPGQTSHSAPAGSIRGGAASQARAAHSPTPSCLSQ